MYKKSLKTMPRSIKKEIIKNIEGFDSVDDIILISQSDQAYKEKELVSKLSSIKGLPSYWLVSSKKDTYTFYVVFESLLTFECENEFYCDDYLYNELFDESASPYYGIY